MKMKFCAIMCCIGIMGLASVASYAETITIMGNPDLFEGTAAFEGQAASATFELVGDTLTITLSNISTWAVSHQTQVLTGLFFNIANPDSSQPDLVDVFQFNPLVKNGNTVTGATAVITSGSSAYSGDTALPQYSDVGGEWGFKEGAILNATETAGYGIGASGLDPIGFGEWDRFNLNKLTNPAAPGGADWGLRSSVMPSTQTGGLLNQNPLIGNSITATFTVLNSDFTTLSQIHDVYFYYGTSATEGRMPGDDTAPPESIPEPASLGLLALGLIGFGIRQGRRG